MLRSLPTSRLATLVLVGLVGCAGIYVAARAGGARAAIPAVIALGCGVALLARSETNADQIALGEIFDGLLLVLPAGLVVYYAFNAGGYFPDSPAIGALALVVVAVLRLTLVERPLAGFSTPLAIAACALGLFAIWTLLSGLWSDSTARTLVEFDRAFAYLLVLVLTGTVVRTATRLRWLAGTLALASVVVAIAALATRLVPDHFHTSIPAIGESNLAYPLTYSNALGILCVLGAILALYFVTSTRLPLAVRALSSAALPLLATTVYLTLSRGPVVAAIIGVAVFVVVGRPSGLFSGLAATVPTSIVAIASAYHHSELTAAKPRMDVATTQGHRVAVVVVACAIAAALLRVLLSPVDARLREYALPPERRRAIAIGAWVAGLAIVIIVAVAIDAPSKISDQYNRFVSSGQASPGQVDVRQSVFSSANRGLVDNWSVAWDAFKDAPLDGQGAGSYETWWYAHRPARQAVYNVTDAHSLYVETLGELGIVGFALLVVLIVAILIALLPVGRGANRPLYAALFATGVAWAAHAGVDWDWEMPAVTAGFLAFGGAALANHERDARPTLVSGGTRITASILLLAAAITPALVLGSQRQLNDARDAVRGGDCGRAIGRATASIDTLEVRPEPYEVLAACQQQRGRTGFAIQAMRKAVARDPQNWRYHFQLGVLLGGAGQNARPELLAAQRLNPHNADVNRLVREAPAGQAVNWDLKLLGPGGALGGGGA